MPTQSHLEFEGFSIMASSPISSELLSRTEAAAYLGVKAQTLAVWACTQRYDLPYVRVGSLVRYRRADLERFIESRLVGVSSGE